MSECMGDPYVAQLRAAKAEGELARIKDELREFAEDNGFNPELEPRELLAKATGAFRSCAAMSDARYEEIQRLKAEMEAMRPRLMPEGMEWLLEVWPRWSNGEYCRFGDWWTADRYGDYEPRQLRRLVIYTPELLDEWEQGDGESYGYEWDFMRPSELDYRPDKVEPPAPAVPAADGEPLEVGQTVWHVATGREYTVRSCTNGGAHLSRDGKPAGYCRADYLTHLRPVLDADGAEIREGDTVWGVESGTEFDVLDVYGVAVDDDFPDHTVRCRRAGAEDYESTMCAPSQLTHRAPVLAADGETIDIGQTVWTLDNPIFECGVIGFGNGMVHLKSGADHLLQREPSDLIHHRPVLDADGVKIRVGDTVWCVATDEELTDMSITRACWSKMREKLTVKSFITDEHGDKWADFEETPLCAKTCYLTHKRPVLDADGVPIKVGDTVYLLPGEWCDEFPCFGFHGGEELEVFADGEAIHVSGSVQCREKEEKVGFRGTCYPQPSQLTHAKPEQDSWERIEADCMQDAKDYCEEHGIEPEYPKHSGKAKCEDLVRRCRALAEREGSE